jgi:hypothetical protein
MYAHDTKHIYYVLAGDRIFKSTVKAIVNRYLRDEIGMDGTDTVIAPIGSDTTIVDLKDMLLDCTSHLRPFALAENTWSVDVIDLADGCKVSHRLLRSAISHWSDECDEVEGRLEEGDDATTALMFDAVASATQ